MAEPSHGKKILERTLSAMAPYHQTTRAMEEHRVRSLAPKGKDVHFCSGFLSDEELYLPVQEIIG